MEKTKYKDLVDKHTPKENRLYNGMIAFITGGFMGALGELLRQLYAYFFDIPTSEATMFMIITLIFI